uniref:Uncharacterized protein n=1 Tax=viral metagenome TaxID=1070528 RepID=A0A6C0ELK7_9ZZZZ
MDDFTTATLHESRNEYSSRLIGILTPLIMEGYGSIFDEAWNLCKENDESEKYLMTFQNLISRVPKWNSEIVEKEKERIIEKSGCTYLEDLLTCVHVIQLKLLTTIRVGKKQKKIEIEIPRLEDFIHKSYIQVARKLYTNVYLYERYVTPLQKQKHSREVEIIVQDCILNAVRETLPIESVLRAYMDESMEEEYIETIQEEKIQVKEEVEEPLTEVEKLKEEIKEKDKETETKIKVDTLNNANPGIRFNDNDLAINEDNQEEVISAPKTIERLEEISNLRNEQRKIDDEDDDDSELSFKLKIGDENLSADNLGLETIGGKRDDNIILSDIEVLK